MSWIFIFIQTTLRRNSYTNIRAATTARNLNKSLQNLNLNEEGRSSEKWSEWENKAEGREINKIKAEILMNL